MNRKSVIILIIVHKERMSDSEKASLSQCYKILGKHPIKLICPVNLDVSVYYEVNPHAEIEFIDSKWQENYYMFNELKKSRFLYQKFREYDYVLFYELDAWVFKDELNYWCNRGYDYIGAPWFEAYDPITKKLTLNVGNGGFSLRNLKKSLSLIKKIDTILWIRKCWYYLRIQSIIKFERLRIIELIFKMKFNEDFHKLIKGYGIHEDIYWAKTVASLFSEFKVAPVQEAFKFSIEGNPSEAFELNGNHLPFGCHAWEKYEPEFWKRFIDIRM